jgi:transmembrane sensor
VSARETEQTAMHWLARREGPGWNTDDETALAVWLSTSTANRVTFLRLERTWAMTSRLPRQAVRWRIPTSKTRWPSRWAITAMAVSAVVVLLAGYGASQLVDLEMPVGTTYSTPVGGRASVTLTDGSQLELNTATRVIVSIGRTRRLTLASGEIFLSVVHDARRPFEVKVGDQQIRDVGTQFGVRRDGSRIVVSVTEGQVCIGTAGSSEAILAGRGEVVTTEGANSSLMHASVDNLNNVFAWRNGWLVFDHTPVSEAAAQFNRYNGLKLQIKDKEVAEVLVSGRFDPTNVQAFSRLVARLGDAVVTSGDGSIILEKRDPRRGASDDQPSL